jgi:hypothetical protein
MSACKHLGDLIAQTSLWIDNEIFFFILPSRGRQEITLKLVEISQSCVHALADHLLNSTKIPVPLFHTPLLTLAQQIRIQAIWTFGNVIKVRVIVEHFG